MAVSILLQALRVMPREPNTKGILGYMLPNLCAEVRNDFCLCELQQSLEHLSVEGNSGNYNLRRSEES